MFRWGIRGPSAIFIAACFLLSLASFNVWVDWRKETPFSSDVDQYYAYLVATVIKKDLTFEFKGAGRYWLQNKKDTVGHKVPKVSVGMAYMYAPFFMIGHVVASTSDKYEADGYSKPYGRWVHWGAILYTILGLVLLRSILLRSFTELVTTLTLATIYLGTNLFYYTNSRGLMSHNYLFFVFALLLYLTVKWHETPNKKHMIGIGATIGLCAILRPLEVLIAFIPLLYGVSSKETLINKWNLVVKYKVHLLVGFLAFWIPIIPQLIYWKWATGGWLFYTYSNNEHFFFNDPLIIDMLFGFRKGWLVYSPLVSFGLIGLFTRKKYAEFHLGITLYIVIMIYLLSAWWCWWFGGGFGMRALVQSYALLALPIASIYATILNNKFLKPALFVVVAGGLYLNFLFTWQYKKRIIHWDSMTQATYWKVFGKWKVNREERKFINANWEKPDYKAAKFGNRGLEFIKVKEEKQ
ncbi:MAG: hypothetical protein HRT71_22180 [Flavobacteriales bacterium]|nr:hypothetical protein [Flavobacteriales bacterium]